MLSVCIIARNEEANLPRAIASVRGIADEIVVADTGSTDTVQGQSLGRGRHGHARGLTPDVAATDVAGV